MSSLDFCACGACKNPSQALCGECRMAEIESLALRHTWQEEPADEDYPDTEEFNGCSTCNKPTNNWFCEECYKTQEVIFNQMESCKCGLDYKVGCKCLPF